MKVLVCNAGSTSLKFKLYDMPECRVLAQCKIERIGHADDAIFQYKNYISGVEMKLEKQNISGYKAGIATFLEVITSLATGAVKDIKEIERVGYKATLSKNFFGVHELTDEVLNGMRAWLPLATLHNTAYIQTIETMRDVLPDALFLGSFETGFHRNIPLERRLYGVPYEWYEKYGIQRLGYHSASHGYIADVLNEREGRKPYKAISCHLGGSCSVCAIENGESIDSSFGMSLQSGLIHATRVGDVDGDLYQFLHSEGLSEEDIQKGFVKKGGLLGLSGVSEDLRYIEEAAEKGNVRAKLAIDVFIAGIVHYIGAFYVDLEGLDYLVFTAGIGENSSITRAKVCEKLSVLGVAIDEDKNIKCKGEADLTSTQSKVKILVVPTDEEFGIARRAFEYVRNQ